MAKLNLDWGRWLYGLAGAAIGGGSGAVVSAVAAWGVTPGTYNFEAGLAPMLKLVGACFVMHAVVGMVLWLKQRPVPEVERPTSKSGEEVTGGD